MSTHAIAQKIYLGVAALRRDDFHIDIGFCSHDGTYSIEFTVLTTSAGEGKNTATIVADFTIDRVRKHAKKRNYKFVSAGITHATLDLSPDLPARMWKDLDIVPLVFGEQLEGSLEPVPNAAVDELADSMARECILYFGPSSQPRVQVGFRNQVGVDAGGHALLTALDQYRQSVGERTWNATMFYIERLKRRNVRIAFFNATAQGGGVALMRHALVRFLRLLGVDVKWYVPIPKPEVFRITKTNHNILQGVAAREERFSDEQAETLRSWLQASADRYWLHERGPLSAPEAGGAHIIIVDDPQMPDLVQIAKNAAPDRPVIFRSHIQIRSDLVDEAKDSPTAHVFAWLYERVKFADMFVSHPVKAFVPNVVDLETVAYLPATTDWLDGLNKELPASDSRFYLHEYNIECEKKGQPRLAFPERDYIVQIARFDPSKGIPDVIASYAKLRRNYLCDTRIDRVPQLVIAGHGAIDDPDFQQIMDDTAQLLMKGYNDIVSDISVMRLGATDQTLNALLSNAKIALQLSTREGFEIKVSEALHKGIPVIATHAGGIPLQVEDGKSGFLVQPGDSDAVAGYLHRLLSDGELYQRMSEYAAGHVSDEVSTVGNALSWCCLADLMTDEGKEKVKPKGRWLNDIAREAAGLPYIEGETRLPRHLST